MICPNCEGPTKVIDTRKGETSIRRRRECKVCRHRFTTYEIRATYLKTLAGIFDEKIINDLWDAGKRIGVAAQWLQELNTEFNRRLVRLK